MAIAVELYVIKNSIMQDFEVKPFLSVKLSLVHSYVQLLSSHKG